MIRLSKEELDQIATLHREIASDHYKKPTRHVDHAMWAIMLTLSGICLYLDWRFGIIIVPLLAINYVVFRLFSALR